jgi:hypothetical protein
MSLVKFSILLHGKLRVSTTKSPHNIHPATANRLVALGWAKCEYHQGKRYVSITDAGRDRLSKSD